MCHFNLFVLVFGPRPLPIVTMLIFLFNLVHYLNTQWAFARKEFEYGQRPTKPDLTYSEVNNRMQRSLDLNLLTKFDNTMIVMGTQIGHLSMTCGNIEHLMAKLEQTEFCQLSQEAPSIYYTVYF